MIAYDPAGRLTAVNRPYTTNGLNQYAATGQPNAAGSVAFTYDANGNLASETPWGGATTGYTYDIENRLVAASGSRTAALRYDPLGRLYEVAAPPAPRGSSTTATHSWRNTTRPARCCAATPIGPAPMFR